MTRGLIVFGLRGPKQAHLHALGTRLPRQTSASPLAWATSPRLRGEVRAFGAAGLTRHSRALHRVVALVLGLVAVAHATPEESARLKAEADRAYVEGDYSSALTKLQAAYKADPNPGLIANQGLVLEQMGEHAASAAAFERFLATKPPAAKARKAHQVLARIKPEVEVVTDPPGATVRLVAGSARSLGTTPLHTRLVVGTHTLELRLAGHLPAEVAVRVWPGRALSVRQALARDPDARVARKVEPEEPGGKRGSVLAWVLLGGAAVAGGAAGAFYVLGDDAVSARDGARTGADWDAHQDDVELWNTSYLAAAGVAGAALVGGVVLLFTGGDEGAQAVVSPGGLTVLGTF